jgi:hypothetical protein
MHNIKLLVLLLILTGCHHSYSKHTEYLNDIPGYIQNTQEYQNSFQTVLSLSTSTHMTSVLSALFHFGLITGMEDANYCHKLAISNSEIVGGKAMTTYEVPSTEEVSTDAENQLKVCYHNSNYWKSRMSVTEAASQPSLYALGTYISVSLAQKIFDHTYEIGFNKHIVYITKTY